MIKQLIKLANHLDKKGLVKEADYLDAIIRKADKLAVRKKLIFWDLGDKFKEYINHANHKFANDGTLRFLPYLRTNGEKAFVLAADRPIPHGGNAYWVECCNCKDSSGDYYMLGQRRTTEEDIKSSLNPFGVISDDRMKFSFKYC